LTSSKREIGRNLVKTRQTIKTIKAKRSGLNNICAINGLGNCYIKEAVYWVKELTIKTKQLFRVQHKI